MVMKGVMDKNQKNQTSKLCHFEPTLIFNFFDDEIFVHKLPSQKDFLNIKVRFTTVFIEVFFTLIPVVLKDNF